VWEIIEAAGWPIWPLIATSVYGFAIILERAWALRASKIMPGHLFDTVHLMLRQGVIKKEKVR
jgi:biopolymer transport protein ExbB